jgi:uncharacterized protein (UPF0335 family)
VPSDREAIQARLEALRARLETLEQEGDPLRQERDQLIREARAAGLTLREIAEASGVSLQRVFQIVGREDADEK